MMSKRRDILNVVRHTANLTFARVSRSEEIKFPSEAAPRSKIT